ncbi:MAG: single-stranded DNA-binding protein [Candidatus Wildermuthbacteria bacterium]|nr:single-stranded DNA-binding protein [Candidatus Wildermuthbacteria bacterium]
MDLNKVMLIGRVVDTPETRSTPSGQTVCNLRVATNRVWTDAGNQRQSKAEFHTVIAWRRLGEIASQYLRKGSLVYVEGRIETRSWQDAQGVKKYRTEIIAERLQLGPKGSEGGSVPFVKEEGRAPQADNKTTPQQKETKEESVEEIPIIEEDEEIDVKDIPF